MPVWLDVIPEKAAQVPRPDTRRWLLFLALIMVAGIVLTLWNWSTERTGFVFWFTALGLPFCLWSLIFSLRRFAYKAAQVGAESRNAAREALIKSEIQRGQRCAWILGSYIQTVTGNKADPLLTAVDQATPQMAISTPRGGTAPVRYAALTAFQKDLSGELDATISKLVARVQTIVEPLQQDLSCWLMLDCDSDIYTQVTEPLNRALLKETGRVFRLMAGKGPAALDAWLDKRWDTPGILAAVTLGLPAAPREGDADAITMMVLSNRKATAFPDAVRLHRPEKGTTGTLGKALTRALLWATLPPEALRSGWFTGPSLIQGSSWNNACEENGVTFSLTEENACLDTALGYAGQASPWLAVALAEAVSGERGPQVIAAQPAADNDDIWIAVITKDDARKELTGNV